MAKKSARGDVTKGKPKPIGGGKKLPTHKTDKNFMSDIHDTGGGHDAESKPR